VRIFPATPPPGPTRPGFWRSPLRGPWLTSVIGLVLLAGVTIVALTGLGSHAAYNPGLGHNAIVARNDDVGFLTFDWPLHPSWLYALTQGLHVNVGLVVIPLLLVKLWSVIPRLFTWPPFTSPAQAIERVGIAALVGSALFEFATGVANMQNWYPFKFNFVVAHYYGALVFIASLLVHVVIKTPVMVRAFREHGLKPTSLPEPYEPGGLVTPNPAAPTLSRRGLLGIVGAGSGVLLVANAGQSIGGPLRSVALLAPRRADGFPVNKTARAARIDVGATGGVWRLRIDGATTVSLSRAELLAMPQHTQTLPIACVEGWSTTQDWTGVRLADLAALAGTPRARAVLVQSLQARGVLRQATLSADQLADDRALLALRVNGHDLSLDHGFPARIIVPALPGVHCTKWVSAMTFEA
jgi:DMSO/TMAO reductase YedYZ molybdopterin-dependent catalytic subunit